MANVGKANEIMVNKEISGKCLSIWLIDVQSGWLDGLDGAAISIANDWTSHFGGHFLGTLFDNSKCKYLRVCIMPKFWIYITCQFFLMYNGLH